MRGTKSHGCREHQRTSENAQDEILHNTIPEEVRMKKPLVLTEEQMKLDMEWKKDLKEWKQAKAIAKQQIASSIPDSLFMKVQTRGTAYKIWTEIGKHFEKRSRMVSIDLH